MYCMRFVWVVLTGVVEFEVVVQVSVSEVSLLPISAHCVLVEGVAGAIA